MPPMLVGVLSDTHDSLDITRRAVDLLAQLGCGALIHCGDLTSTPVLDLLAGEIPAYFVFGNNDFERRELAAYAAHLNITCLGTHGTVTLADTKIAVAHGDLAQPLRAFAADPSLAYVLTGHTHVAHDFARGPARHVNPGALHRTRSPSVATLDLPNSAVKFHKL